MIRLTRQQVRNVDRLAVERYRMPSIVLMENAARAVAATACDMLGGDCVGEVLIVCGGGNNGGDGLAAARLLHNSGADVTIALTIDADSYKGDARINRDIVDAMGLDAKPMSPSLIRELQPVLIIDAIFGTGLTQIPREPFAELVDAINKSGCPVLAVDVPSGLDCDTGKPFGPCIRAARTVTFVAEKVGFTAPEARQYLGEVTIGDIGCPRELIEEVARS